MPRPFEGSDGYTNVRHRAQVLRGCLFLNYQEPRTKNQETKFQGTPNNQLPTNSQWVEEFGSWELGVPWHLVSWPLVVDEGYPLTRT